MGILDLHQANVTGCLEYNQDKLHEGGNPIALCEVLMLPLCLWHHAHRMRARNILWIVDNTVALAAAIKGGSTNRHLARSVELFHMLSYFYGLRIWLEYVPSALNYADGISRDLGQCQWAAKEKFCTTECSVPECLWECTLQEAWTACKHRSSVGEESK